MIDFYNYNFRYWVWKNYGSIYIADILHILHSLNLDIFNRNVQFISYQLFILKWLNIYKM